MDTNLSHPVERIYCLEYGEVRPGGNLNGKPTAFPGGYCFGLDIPELVKDMQRVGEVYIPLYQQHHALPPSDISEEEFIELQKALETPENRALGIVSENHVVIPPDGSKVQHAFVRIRIATQHTA